MRLIDADALTTEILGMRYTEEAPSVIFTKAGQEIFNSGVEAANFAVHDAPTIDAAPVVHARWDDGHRCTECICLCTTAKMPQGHLIFIETPYCPNCGARMDKMSGEDTDGSQTD